MFRESGSAKSAEWEAVSVECGVWTVDCECECECVKASECGAVQKRGWSVRWGENWWQQPTESVNSVVARW